MRGGFVSEKWVNTYSVLQTIAKDQNRLHIERALGLLWCVESDSFSFKMEVKQQSLTRWGTLSTTTSVYDALGFLSPITLSTKMLQQELCRRNCGWDDAIPPDILQRWEVWLLGVKLLSSFKTECCLKPETFGKPICSQDCQQRWLWHCKLHHCDDHAKFLLGKTSVTPIMAVTIPRLEWTAAVLAARVDGKSSWQSLCFGQTVHLC